MVPNVQANAEAVLSKRATHTPQRRAEKEVELRWTAQDFAETPLENGN